MTNIPFGWRNENLKTKNRLLRRTKTLALSNPDFKTAHPELAREAEAGNTDVEIKKYVRLKLERVEKYAKVPKDSIIIKRYNRVG